MAAKRKQRYSPDPSLGTPSTGGSQIQVPTARGSGAARPPSSQPLAQLSGQLSRFNKALVGYQMGKMEKGTEEAQQYAVGMSAEISAKSYGFRRFLKKMGFSQWRNPWVYSKQIVNVAANQANKDFASLLVDKEFQSEMKNLKQTAGVDYEEKAGQLFDKNRAEKFNREAEFKKEGAYWDIGYGENWQKLKDQAILKGIFDADEYKKLNVRRAFFEGGRDQLWASVKAGDKSAFRKYISENFSTVPFGPEKGGSDNIKTGVAIFKNIIMPVFQELVERGDDLDDIAKMYKDITSMSRDVLNEDGVRTGGVKLFKDKHADIDPSDQRYLSIQQFWRMLEDKYDSVSKESFAKIGQSQAAIENKAKADLRSLEDTKKQYPEIFKAHGLMDLQFPFDANDTALMRKVASAFAEIYADDVEELGGVKAEDDRLFFEIFTHIVETANSDIVSGASKATLAIDTFNQKTADLVGRFIENSNLAPDILETIHDSISRGRAGSPNRYPKEWLNDLGPSGIQDLFYNAHPDIVRGSIAWSAAIERYMAPITNGALVQTAHDQLRVIQGKYRIHQTTEDDLHTLWALKADLTNNKEETALRAEIDNLASRVALRNDNSAIFNEVKIGTFKTGIVDTAMAELRTGVNGKLIAGIEEKSNMAVKVYNPDDPTSLVPHGLRDAAKLAMSWFKGEFYDQAADEAMSWTLDQIDTSVDKKTWWAGKGITLYKKDLGERLLSGVSELKQRYEDSANRTKALEATGTEAQRNERTFLTPEDTGRATKLDQVVTALKGFWDEKEMNSGQYLEDTTSGQDHPMLETFFAGPEGNKFWRNIKEINDAAKVAFDAKLSTHADAVTALKDAEAGDGSWFSSKSSQIKEAQEDLQSARLALKDHARAFQALSWEDIVDDNFHLTIENAFGEAIKVKLTEDEMNLNNVLVFQSLEGMQGLTEEYNALTEKWDVDEPPTDVKLDPKKASEKLQKWAGVFKTLHGVDLLHPEYRQRAAAEEVLEGVWRSQANMLMAKFPERVPTEVFQALEHSALENFIASDRTKWQNKEIPTGDKEWVSGVFRQRRAMLNGKHNLGDGITYETFIKLYRESTGNTLPLSAPGVTRRLKWTETRGDMYDKDVELRTKITPEGFLGKANKYVSFKDTVRINISNEIARGSLGVPNPHDRSNLANRADVQQAQAGKFGEEWNWGLHQAVEKYSGILKRAAEYPESPSTELAEAFNALATALGSQRFVRPGTGELVPNMWGMTPMLIPAKPAPLKSVMHDPTPDALPEESKEKPFSLDQYIPKKDK